MDVDLGVGPRTSHPAGTAPPCSASIRTAGPLKASALAMAHSMVRSPGSGSSGAGGRPVTQLAALKAPVGVISTTPARWA